MPFVRYKDRNVLFIHIPRTGGTAVDRWLNELGELKLFNHSLPAFSKVTPQHLRINDVEELFGGSFFDYAFTIVRNPFDRIASEYRMRCNLGLNIHWQGPPRFPTWLENALEVYRKNPFHLDNHLRPQWEFVSARLGIFRHEDGLATVLERVAGDIGAPRPGALAPKLARDEGAATVHFDVAETARVLDVYGRDFETFGYAKTPPA
jgi:hypothetical protein